MSASFLDDFDGDYFDNSVLEELQTALAKAVKSSPKSIVIAHYPTKNYETAAMRLHIEANLETIRKNRNNQKGIKIYVDGILDSGGYTSDIDPNFAMTQVSYSQFCSLTKIRFCKISPYHWPKGSVNGMLHMDSYPTRSMLLTVCRNRKDRKNSRLY